MSKDFVRHVTRSRPIRCSALGRADSCRLRLVLKGEPRYRSPLPSSPEATLGRLVHRAFANWRSDKPPASASPLLNLILDGDISVRSAASPTGEVTLRDALGIPRILGKIPAKLRGVPIDLSESSHGFSTDNASSGFPEPPFSATEFRLEAGNGELHGRVDLLEVGSHGSATVTEFKTGRVFTRDGDVRNDYRLQVEAYGLLVLEAGLASAVQLRLVGADAEWESEFDERSADRVRELLGRITQKIPQGRAIDASELATVGETCRFCAFRPICPKYRAEAPSLWASPSTHRLPYDTWGKVTDIQDDGASTLRIRVRDEADRLVCVFGVPERLVGAVRPGSTIALYSLRAAGDSGTTHPRNFKIVAPRMEDSAHSAFVVTEGG